MNEYVPELISLAESRGFPRLAHALESLESRLTIPSASYPDVDAPPGTDLMSVLGQIVRRGLAPPLVEALLAYFADRPIERGLIAWDVLSQSIIPDWEGTRIASLQTMAEAVTGLLPPPGEAGAHGGAPIEPTLAALGGGLADASVDDILDAVGVHNLAAYEVVRTREPELIEELRSSEVIATLRSFAQLLSLAHLPTLASLQLEYAMQLLRDGDAAWPLAEVLCDAEAAQRLPPTLLPDGDGPIDLRNYAALRTLLVRGAPDTAFGMLGDRYGGGARPDSATLPDPIALVYAELTADIGELGVPADRLARITTTNRLWRYAARVSVTAALRFSERDSSLPLHAIHTFVTGFGNDYRLWRAVLSRLSVDQRWFGAAVGVLVREAVASPHDRAAWSALEYLFDPIAVDSEVRERARVQSTL